jgi:hypothetical protein
MQCTLHKMGCKGCQGCAHLPGVGFKVAQHHIRNCSDIPPGNEWQQVIRRHGRCFDDAGAHRSMAQLHTRGRIIVILLVVRPELLQQGPAMQDIGHISEVQPINRCPMRACTPEHAIPLHPLPFDC